MPIRKVSLLRLIPLASLVLARLYHHQADRPGHQPDITAVARP